MRRNSIRTALTIVLTFTLGLSVAAYVGFRITKSWVKNPIKTVVVDRTPPPVMISLKELALYKAASGDYEVLIDVEKDVKYVPKALAGSRTLFIGVGSVDATVDFRGVADSAIITNADRTSAVITLPHASLSQATIDVAQSHVVARDRGLVDRIKGAAADNPENDKELYLAAQAKMQAAAEASGLTDKAEANTTKMLTSMLQQLGFTQIEVKYEGEAPAGPVSISVAPSV